MKKRMEEVIPGTEGTARSPGRFRVRRAAALVLLAAVAALSCAFSGAAENQAPARKLTLMVYMCGSNLESSYGSASTDISEMMGAKRDPRTSTVLVMTGGSGRWMMGYPADQNQVIELGLNRTVWREEKRSMGAEETLTEFLRLGISKYPAEEYALILWDHGGGPLDGVCWDELFSMDSLSLKELCGALEKAELPKKLAWIGFDACLMGSAEVAAAVSPYAEYMIASQEEEPKEGWNYRFLEGITEDRNGAETGRRIIDAYFETLEDSPNPLTLACIDLGAVGEALKPVDSFFANVGRTVNRESYTDLSAVRFNATGFGKAQRDEGDAGYDLVDLQDLVRQLGRNGNDRTALERLRNAVVYSRSTVEGATGLSVYHPFANKKKYAERWKADYNGVSFSAGYRDYINSFGAILTSGVLADWRGMAPEVSEEGEIPVFRLQLTEEQRKTYARGQLRILAVYDEKNGFYGTGTEGNSPEGGQYFQVASADARLRADGTLEAEYGGRTLYVTDPSGKPVCGPLSYTLSEDGKTVIVQGSYHDESGREDAAQSLRVQYAAAYREDGETLQVTGVRGYDRATKTFSARIPVEESEYTRLYFDPDLRCMPGDTDDMPGFERWQENNLLLSKLSVSLPSEWELRFFDTQMSAVQLYAVFQTTDTQQNTHCSRPVLLRNPNLENVKILPRENDFDGIRAKYYLIRDTSPLAPGVNLGVEVTNDSLWTATVTMESLTVNGNRGASPDNNGPVYLKDLAPGETRLSVCHIPDTALANLEEIREVSGSLYCYFTNHTSGNYRKQLRLEVEDCSLEGIAKRYESLLGSGEAEGLRWDLVRLEQNAAGNLEGTLRIVNSTAEAVETFADTSVNGVMTENSDDFFFFCVPAEAEIYYPFTVTNRCCLFGQFRVDGWTTYRYMLNAENQLEQHGVTEISELEMMISGAYSVDRTVKIPLAEKIRIADAEAEAPASGVLMTGAVGAEVERVYLADDGAAIRAVFTNHTQEAVTIRCGGAKVNGRDTGEVQGSTIFPVPAGGRAIVCMGIRDSGMPEEERPERIGMIFRVNNEYCSTEAEIRLPGAEDSRYVSPEECGFSPAVYDRPEIRMATDTAETEDWIIRADGRFISGSASAWGNAFDTEETSLRFTVRVTNLEDRPRSYNFSALEINGTRVTGARWFPGTAEPGETKEAWAYVSPEELTGIGEIRGFSCTVFAYGEKDYHPENAVRVEFTTEPADVRALAPEEPVPLGKAEGKVLAWQALEIREDGDGRLDLLLHAENRTEDLSFSGEAYLTAEGWTLGTIPELRLEPGQDRILRFTAENRVKVPATETEVFNYPYPTDGTEMFFPLEDHLLERRGVSAIGELRILTGVNPYSYTADEDLPLRLEEPVPLSDTPPAEAEERLTVVTGPLEIRVNHVLVGDLNVTVSLDILNNTEYPLLLTPENPAVNGTGWALYGSYHTMTLMPYAGETVRLSLKQKSGSLRRGDAVQDITLRWSLLNGNVPESTFTLMREAHLGEEGGRVITGAELMENVSQAKMLLLTQTKMGTESWAPVRLVPALSPEQAAAFREGIATVSLRRNPGEGRSGKDTVVSERICSAELRRTPEGTIAAEYSGLAWVNSSGETLEYAEFADDEEEDVAYAYLLAALFRTARAYRRIPAETSLEDGNPDYFLIAGYRIEPEDGKPVITGHVEYARNPEGEDVSEWLMGEDLRLICAAEQEIITRRGGEILERRFEKRQIVRLDDLSLIRADGLEGTLEVRYDLTYEDGTAESLLEAYPYR